MGALGSVKLGSSVVALVRGLHGAGPEVGLAQDGPGESN